MTEKSKKPLGIKAYGSIPHLPGSRRGPGDRGISEAQARIAIEQTRDDDDCVIVQEKLDGSCVAIAKIDDAIVPLVRAGYRAESSPWEQHQLFAQWVYNNHKRFEMLLQEGERFCGEWLALAHSTRYELPHEPFVAFDLMQGGVRAPYLEMKERLGDLDSLVTPRILSIGKAISVEEILPRIAESGHGAIDPVEGAVWRVERKGKFDFICKWVRHDKIDGAFFTEISGQPEIWNWRP